MKVLELQKSSFDKISVKQDSKYIEDAWWKWSVWLEGADLDKVDYVVYTLHHSFANPIKKVTTKSTKFRLKASGWGGFIIHIKVYFLNDTTLDLNHTLELSYPNGNLSMK